MFNDKNLFLTLLFILFSMTSLSLAQKNDGAERYSKVRIYATTENDFKKISDAGLFFDGGISKRGIYFETWLSESEIIMLRNSGVPFEITINDWLKYYNEMQRNNYVSPDIVLSDTYTISHNIYGTMGGHLKWEEAIAKLDSMRLEYPAFVSVKWSIGNSYENRPMWTIRITKNPDAPTGRPEVWLNGVTHAREPIGMMNVYYYLYWLLENYNIDPIATYILNNREIYFTPFINPDGYYYNQTTNPNGGGMWRKNRQPYSSSIGADLNRNFGTYNFWNSTNNGSSTSPSSDTYRGSYPFSCPEDSNYKVFFNSRNFKVGLDYHSYGNYLLKPYYWCDPNPTPHDAIFNEMGADMVSDNGFTFGTSSKTLQYFIRGGDLDWCYSSDSTGHSTNRFFMLPEVGTTGFWPTQGEIIPLSQSCMNMNILISLFAGSYTGLKTITQNKESYVQNESGTLKVVFRNKGLMDASNVKIQLTPLSTYVTIPVQEYTKVSLPSRTSDSVVFNFTISGTCPNNFGIPTRLKILQNDTVTFYNKIHYILVGNGTAILVDSAENGFNNWISNETWTIMPTQYHSPFHSFTDSPLGIYSFSTNNMMTLNFPLNTSSSPVVFLSFWHVYLTEAGYDFCRVEVSSNNGTNWNEIKSFSGNLQTWTYQSLDITTLCNSSQNVRIRFRLTSDNSINYDGWYVDDIKISGYQSVPTGVGSIGNVIPNKFELQQNYPNPFNPSTQINYSIAKEGLVKITIFDVLGREVKVLVNEVRTPGYYSVDFDGALLSSGMYFYRMESGSFVDTKKMTLIK